MRQITRDLLTDCSVEEEFHFSLRCAECGSEWHSLPVRFSKAGVRPETEGKRVIFRTLYEREREQERQHAAETAARRFNRCPICGRLVCDRCFLICDDLDLCTACARHLNESGTPIRDADGTEP